MAKRVNKKTSSKDSKLTTDDILNILNKPNTTKKVSKTPPKKRVVKKTDSKTVKKVTTKKSTSNKKSTSVKKNTKTQPKKIIDNPTTTRKKPIKSKKIMDKFIKISENAKSEEFKVFGDRVQNDEIVWSYYTIENDIGYHYYKLKK